jgi:hypothetical protein
VVVDGDLGAELLRVATHRVEGGGREIGRSIATAYAQEGARHSSLLHARRQRLTRSSQESGEPRLLPGILLADNLLLFGEPTSDLLSKEDLPAGGRT